MNISFMHHYSNKPINPVDAIKAESTQSYIQQKNQNSDSSFLNILNNALKNIHPDNTAVAHSNTVQENFFSLLNNAYHSLLGVNTDSINGLPSNFSGYFTKKPDRDNNNTLFDQVTTISGNTKKAHKAYNASAMLESTEDKEIFRA